MANVFEMALKGGSNIFAASGLDNIRNCLCAIAATRVGSVPLYRHFGTDWQWVDRPEPAAMARYRAELMEAIAKFEPRVEILSISFKAEKTQAMDGRIYPVIRFRLADGVTL